MRCYLLEFILNFILRPFSSAVFSFIRASIDGKIFSKWLECSVVCMQIANPTTAEKTTTHIVIADKGFCQDKKQITNSNISILFLLKKHFVVKRTNKRKVNNPPNARDAASHCVSLWDRVEQKKTLWNKKQQSQQTAKRDLSNLKYVILYCFFIME